MVARGERTSNWENDNASNGQLIVDKDGFVRVLFGMRIAKGISKANAKDKSSMTYGGLYAVKVNREVISAKANARKNPKGRRNRLKSKSNEIKKGSSDLKTMDVDGMTLEELSDVIDSEIKRLESAMIKSEKKLNGKKRNVKPVIASAFHICVG